MQQTMYEHTRQPAVPCFRLRFTASFFSDDHTPSGLTTALVSIIGHIVHRLILAAVNPCIPAPLPLPIQVTVQKLFPATHVISM
jgi:hypothetical protein